MNSTLNLKPIIVAPIAIGQNIPASLIKAPVNDFLRPVAPLVTAQYIKDAVNFRIVVFIDSNNTKAPTLGVASNNKDFYLQYDSREEVPKSYTAWYIDVFYTCKYVDKVTVYNNDIDPVTSRGTETTVQQG
ncbi:hypothetical protein BC952_3026 [Flavobacterium limicola]|uniref:Uncharacterized protein n=1 Tax=Flavobacterium limicola TaxID=180441 RepID=A0A495RRB7_9FLAO|nr:hypothetical protein [Flavobacterium limicola]RKS89696.1 hypothetical protein BC952_3026 [Flavobacterium limicola]